MSFPVSNCPARVLPLIALAISSLVEAQDKSPATTPEDAAVTATSTAQAGVLTHSEAVGDNLANLIDEMKLNGLSDAQIATVLKASDHLDSLNQEDMQKVLSLVKSVSTLSQDSDQQAALLTAYQQQKTISTQLKSVSLELARQATTETIIQKLEALILRQAANLRATQKLRDTRPQNLQMSVEQQRLLARATSEQNAIGRDTALLGQTLAAAPQANAAAAPDDVTGLNSLSTEAARQTNERNLAAAAINQGLLKEKLTRTLAEWKARQDEETRLEQARAQVDHLIRDQTALANPRGPRGPQLAERQAQIADRVELARDVAQLNAPASTQLAQARAAMQQNSDSLSAPQNRSADLPAQEATMGALNQAAQLLADQAKAAQDKNDESLADAQKDLQKLKNDIDHTKDAVQSKADPAQAGDIAKLQKDAQPTSPDAAQKLGDAAAQLKTSQPNSAAATQSLAAASKSVQDQLDAAARAAEEAALLEKADAALDEAVAKAKDASASLQDEAHPDHPRVNADLTRAQSILHDVDGQMDLPEAAHAIFTQANANFDAGNKASARGKSPEAKKSVDAGIKSLEDAQDKLAAMKAAAEGKGLAALGKGPGKNGPHGLAHHDGHHRPDDDKNPDGSEKALAGGDDLHASGAQVIGALTPKDRDAITQAEAEKVPPEYAPMVQQYMKNLSDSSSP